jgi:acylphosphatase
VNAERIVARITGRVQGVGFRWWVRTRAESLNLTGWVMNDDDERSVTVIAEGPPLQLDELERLVRIGPSSARVEAVEVRREPASGEFRRFEISRR